MSANSERYIVWLFGDQNRTTTSRNKIPVGLIIYRRKYNFTFKVIKTYFH